MPNVQSPGQVRVHLQTIRTKQRDIETQIRAVQQQLKLAEGMPSTQPWISLKVGTGDVRDLRSPHRTLKEALQHDLLQLRTTLKELGLETKALQQQITQRNANRASTDFKTRLEDALKKAEQQGHLDKAALGALIKEGEQVLNQFVALLDGTPSLKNAEAVLGSLALQMLLGADGDTGASGKAWRSLAKAGERLHEQADQSFRRTPTSANLKKLLDMRAVGQQLGSGLKEQPDGWRPAKTSHRVQKGESLSMIAQRYYGSPKYWDVIFLENFGAIADPDKVPVGAELSIP